MSFENARSLELNPSTIHAHGVAAAALLRSLSAALEGAGVRFSVAVVVRVVVAAPALQRRNDTGVGNKQVYRGA